MAVDVMAGVAVSVRLVLDVMAGVAVSVRLVLDVMAGVAVGVTLVLDVMAVAVDVAAGVVVAVDVAADAAVAVDVAAGVAVAVDVAADVAVGVVVVLGVVGGLDVAAVARGVGAVGPAMAVATAAARVSDPCADASVVENGSFVPDGTGCVRESAVVIGAVMRDVVTAPGVAGPEDPAGTPVPEGNSGSSTSSIRPSCRCDISCVAARTGKRRTPQRQIRTSAAVPRNQRPHRGPGGFICRPQ
jgi:hypothetical protein